MLNLPAGIFLLTSFLWYATEIQIMKQDLQDDH